LIEEEGEFFPAKRIVSDPDPGYYMQMSSKPMIYLPVDFQQAIIEFNNNNSELSEGDHSKIISP